jgi:hypothetical protein
LCNQAPEDGQNELESLLLSQDDQKKDANRRKQSKAQALAML